MARSSVSISCAAAARPANTIDTAATTGVSRRSTGTISAKRCTNRARRDSARERTAKPTDCRQAVVTTAKLFASLAQEVEMDPFPHTYRVRGVARDGQDPELLADGLPRLPTASPPEFGGPGDRWSPETLLVGAI